VYLYTINCFLIKIAREIQLQKSNIKKICLKFKLNFNIKEQVNLFYGIIRTMIAALQILFIFKITIMISLQSLFHAFPCSLI